VLSPDKNRDGVVRFGAFELDPENGELRKHGRPIRLSPQPLEVLSVLASQPGKLISREELRHQVWNGTTFVDFEQGLNFCVRRIRAALGDDADKPRFIETVPRRGYRFIAPVDQAVAVSPISDHLSVISGMPADALNGNGHPATELHQNEIISRRKSHSRVLARLVSGLVLVAVCAIPLVWFDTRPEQPPRIIRVIPITNDGRQKFANNTNFLAPLVSDGSRLYFQETAFGHTAIAQAAVTGGETELLSTPFHDAQLVGISPDHANILLAGMSSASSLELPFYSLPVVGGTAKKLGDFVAHDAAWSPRGDQLVYATNNEIGHRGQQWREPAETG
jgi:DNA-binding winged helix-turn-helix (wHTH) protein